MTQTQVVDNARHSEFSDPGPSAALLQAVPPDIGSVAAVARNVIEHYRASDADLPEATRGDVNLRWVSEMLRVDQKRHGRPLASPRRDVDRLQGCCRDHTLLAVAILREHGVPARSRVGFAGYFVDGWHHDHVVVEAWLEGRWRRFDAELDAPRPGVDDPTDLPFGDPAGQGFCTAAAAWSAYRQGRIDPARFGVDPALPEFSGPRFLWDEVVHEVAHRFGCELLLWDGWGGMGEPSQPVSDTDALAMDDLAAGLLAADAGDTVAERRVHALFSADPRFAVGGTVTQFSPLGGAPVEVALRGGDQT